MSGRSYPVPHGMRGPLPRLHPSLPIFGHDLVQVHTPHHIHPALLEEMREGAPHFIGGVHGPLPLHPALIQGRYPELHHEIQDLLLENQRLAVSHVAINQELVATEQDLQRVSGSAGALQAARDAELREVHDKSLKMEAELRAAEAKRAELIQVRGEVQMLNAARQDLTAQIQFLSQNLATAYAELQQAPAIKAEVETMKQEVQRVRDAIEHEKKGYAENYEQGQVIEKNLILMAREVEKLRAEVVITEKRTQVAATVGNQAAGFVGNYANPDPSYGGNPYASGYGLNPAPGGGESGAPYGAASGPGLGSWTAYDMQRAHGWR